MDQYLFYQTHKKELPLDREEESKGGATYVTADGEVRENLRLSITQKNFFSLKVNEMERLGKLPAAKTLKSPTNQFISKVATPAGAEGEFDFNPFELNSDSMKPSLDQVSEQYNDQYAKAGYPPKISSIILKQLCNMSKLQAQILDVGCGKGLTGEYLKKDGFMHITGMDASQSLLNVASAKKVYDKVERVAFGLTPSAIGKEHTGKYDFIVASSMINNDGWDRSIFMDLLKLLKMGGFLIFATKLNLHNDNQYSDDINILEEQMHWKYVTEHTFYRYDKLCDGHGKFSNKKVKIMAYEKTDHTVWCK